MDIDEQTRLICICILSKKINAALNSTIHISETGDQNTLKFGANVAQSSRIMVIKKYKI